MTSNRGPSRVVRVLKPLEEFFRIESSSGFVLLGATLCALFWANSPWSALYGTLWHSAASHIVVNDVLMTAFFLVVGLEIRREAHEGALSSLRAATLPIAAALGGIVVPAAIYLLLNRGDEVRQGWAIPTATDIAFAVGVLTLLGNRVHPALRALLLALAIADDVAAILVIAFFYSDGVAVSGLLVAAGGLAGLAALRRFEARRASTYLAAGAVLWLGLLLAGVHPVLAGVVVGLFMPGPTASELEHALHPWVAYGVMPLFALGNAGIAFGDVAFGDEASQLVAGGIGLALLAGKPLGIMAAAAFAVKSRVCRLPDGVTWSGMALIGCLGGIGFTMSIFIATLAFSDAALLASAKLGVLAASLLSGAAALVIGHSIRGRSSNARTHQSAASVASGTQGGRPGRCSSNSEPSVE
jgi:NhaA family Na+:H+ antiporter